MSKEKDVADHDMWPLGPSFGATWRAVECQEVVPPPRFERGTS